MGSGSLDELVGLLGDVVGGVGGLDVALGLAELAELAALDLDVVPDHLGDHVPEADHVALLHVVAAEEAGVDCAALVGQQAVEEGPLPAVVLLHALLELDHLDLEVEVLVAGADVLDLGDFGVGGPVVPVVSSISVIPVVSSLTSSVAALSLVSARSAVVVSVPVVVPSGPSVVVPVSVDSVPVVPVVSSFTAFSPLSSLSTLSSLASLGSVPVLPAGDFLLGDVELAGGLDLVLLLGDPAEDVQLQRDVALDDLSPAVPDGDHLALLDQVGVLGPQQKVGLAGLVAHLGLHEHGLLLADMGENFLLDGQHEHLDVVAVGGPLEVLDLRPFGSLELDGSWGSLGC